MKEREIFLNGIKEIHQLACKYGQNNVEIDISKLLSKEDLENFTSKCHIGFKEAQDLIITNLIEIELEKKKLTSQIKEHRRNREKELEKKKLFLTRVLDYREKLIRKLADSIAWHMIAGHHYIARRLFLGETYPSLLSEGFDTVKKVVDDLNKNTAEFALISDLTSFIQIGDIFHRSSDGYHLIEVKSGKKNEVAETILHDLYTKKENDEKCKMYEYLDENMLKQLERMHRQNIKAAIAIDTIKNEKGFDLKTGHQVYVMESNADTGTYIDVIRDLISASKTKKWGYNVIDGILHIGVYREEWVPLGKEILSQIVKEECGKDFPLFNFMQNISMNICEPIFLKELPEEDLFDLISGKVVIFMIINFEKLIELFKFIGYDAGWLSTKKTHRLKEQLDASSIFIFNNQAIYINYESMEFHIGDGIITRIIGDNLKPFNVALGFIDIINNAVNNMKNNS
jgi:hypothetical protein